MFGKIKKKLADNKAARKEKKAEIKQAKNEKKDAKKKIKADKKSGKISPKQARDLKKKARKDMRDKVGSGLARAAAKINKLNPSAVLTRNSFLSLLKINAAGLASAFGQMRRDGGKDWKKFLKKWSVFGGSEASLNTQIDLGTKKRPFPSFKKKKRSVDSWDSGAEWINAEAVPSADELNTNDPKNAGATAA